MGQDVTGMRVDVELTLDVAPGTLWSRITDVTRIGEWSPECEHGAWLDGAGPRPGARFEGRNRFPGGFVGEVVCVVTEAAEPHTFGWAVLDQHADPRRPSSTWSYTLRAGDTPGQTRVRHTFVHGPGGSGVRDAVHNEPERAETIVEQRRTELRGNMTSTLRAMAAA